MPGPGSGGRTVFHRGGPWRRERAQWSHAGVVARDRRAGAAGGLRRLRQAAHAPVPGVRGRTDRLGTAQGAARARTRGAAGGPCRRAVRRRRTGTPPRSQGAWGAGARRAAGRRARRRRDGRCRARHGLRLPAPAPRTDAVLTALRAGAWPRSDATDRAGRGRPAAACGTGGAGRARPASKSVRGGPGGSRSARTAGEPLGGTGGRTGRCAPARDRKGGSRGRSDDDGGLARGGGARTRSRTPTVHSWITSGIDGKIAGEFRAARIRTATGGCDRILSRFVRNKPELAGNLDRCRW